MTHPEWTPEELAQLSAMRAQKLPTKQIALALGRSYRAVKDKAWRLGLVCRREWSPQEDLFLIDHVGKLTQAQIAQALRITRREVRSRVAALQLHNKEKSERARRAAAERAEGGAMPKRIDDTQYVEACLQHGGFAVNVVIDGKTYSITRRAA